jgi:hypothetical protein
MIGYIKEKYNISFTKKKIDIEYDDEIYSFAINSNYIIIDFEFILNKTLYIKIINFILEILKTGVFFVICNNFELINNDVLPYFYLSVENYKDSFNFILLSNSISFVNYKILRCFEIVRIPTTTKEDSVIITQYKHICDIILQQIYNPKTFTFFKFRTSIYDILTYKLNIYSCIWYVLSEINKKKSVSSGFINGILPDFFINFYHNNKTIYNLEYIFMLIFKEYNS